MQTKFKEAKRGQVGVSTYNTSFALHLCQQATDWRQWYLLHFPSLQKNGFQFRHFPTSTEIVLELFTTLNSFSFPSNTTIN